MIWLLLGITVAGPVELAYIFGDVPTYGYYFVDLWVGSPPVKQTVIVDTGSRLTAFPCIGCTECGTHLDRYFDYLASNTSRIIGCGEQLCHSCENQMCTYQQSYAEGSSIAGVLVEDLVMFGDSLNPDFQTRLTFGCHYRETNLFKTQAADGIMGLAHADRSGKSIIDAMYSAHEVTDDVFSICLGISGGFMALGGFNASVHSAPISWVDMQDGTFYSVRFRNLYVDSAHVPAQETDYGHSYGTGTIIDSGTTFVYMATAVYQKLWDTFEQHCRDEAKCRGERHSVVYEPHQCFLYSPDEHSDLQGFFDTFPVLSLDLGGQNLKWQPEHYLYNWPEFPDLYCLGVYDNGRSGSVLGALLMRGHDFVFDRNADRMGFAPSLCDLEAPLQSRPPRKGVDQPMQEPILSNRNLVIAAVGAGLAGLLLLGLFGVVCCRRCSRKYEQLGSTDSAARV